MAQTQRQMIEMFTATVDRFIEHGRENHVGFRNAIIQLQAEQTLHTANWQTLMKVAVIPVLLAVAGAILALVLK